MDLYTQRTKQWLEKRYQRVNASGIYYAHQPIYGFAGGCSEPGLTTRYSGTYTIMKTLAGLRFRTLLDVGTSEGYKAYLVQQMFGAKVKGTDLSEEACQRAKEIFGIEAAWADIHNLPYGNEEFDVVLCSETLEHVADLSMALEELLRVAKKAVVITVPHETPEDIEENIREKVDHGHIHYLHTGSFDFLNSRGYAVTASKFDIRLLQIPRRLLDANPHEGNNYHPKVTQVYNRFLQPLLKKAFNNRLGAFLCYSLIKLDEHLSPLAWGYNGILVVIMKDPSCVIDRKERARVSVHKIINTTVPYHYLGTPKRAV
jgi:SAM-dependent methyltransferase